MENSPNSIEMQIDNFLEHFKRSASKAMDSDWSATASGANLGKSKSRSSCLDVSELSDFQMDGELQEEHGGQEDGELIEVVEEVDDDSPLSLNCNEKKDESQTGFTAQKGNKRKKLKSGSSADNPDSSDDEENKDSPEEVALRLKRGCECSSECFKELDPKEVYKHRLNIAELTKDEHDMYLMGVTMACMYNSKTTLRQKERQRHRATYVYQGKRVCLEAFLFLENVSLYHIKTIRSHVLAHGVTPRIHGNLGKKAHNAFSLDVYRNVEDYVKKFLKPYITDFNKNQIVYGINRADVYHSYRDHGRKPNEKLMGYSTFKHFMKKRFPQIKFQRDHSGRHSSGEASGSKSKKTKSNWEARKNKVPIKVIPGDLSFNVDVSSGIMIKNDSNAGQDQQTAYIFAPISIDSPLIKAVQDKFPMPQTSGIK